MLTKGTQVLESKDLKYKFLKYKFLAYFNYISFLDFPDVLQRAQKFLGNPNKVVYCKVQRMPWCSDPEVSGLPLFPGDVGDL